MSEISTQVTPEAEDKNPVTPAQQPTEATPNASSPGAAAQPWLTAKTLISMVEPATKVAAGFLLAAYVAGYLIVSIRDSSFGFTELSPFKPKILGAGILFSALTAIPVYAAQKFFSREYSSTDALAKAAELFSRTVVYWYACSLATTGLGMIIAQKTQPGPILKLPSSMALITRTFADPLSLRGAAPQVVSLILFFGLVKRTKFSAKHPGLTICGSLLLLAINLLSGFLQHEVQGSLWMELWFFGSGVLLRPLVRTTLNEEWKKGQTLTSSFYLPIAALFYFSRFVYPSVEASWGGGHPVPVVLYFNSSSPFRPGEPFPALLLDESEAGYYFVEENRSHALFMPRSQVSMLYFSDKPLPPAPSAPAAPSSSQAQPAKPTSPASPADK
jgi:hypothetical protein